MELRVIAIESWVIAIESMIKYIESMIESIDSTSRDDLKWVAVGRNFYKDGLTLLRHRFN